MVNYVTQCCRSPDKPSELGEIVEVEESGEAPEEVKEDKTTENEDKETGAGEGTSESEVKEIVKSGKEVLENGDKGTVEKEDKVVISPKDEKTVETENKEEIVVEVHENEVGKEPAVTADTSPKEEGQTVLPNSTSSEPGAETPNNIERTDSGPPASEGDSVNSPQVLEGDNVESFSSVKHLLSS